MVKDNLDKFSSLLENEFLMISIIPMIKKLTKNRQDINAENLYDGLEEFGILDDLPKNYLMGKKDHVVLQRFLSWISEHYSDKDSQFGQNYILKLNSINFAHIENQDKEFNLYHWNDKKKYWSFNSSHFILEKLLLIENEDFSPNSFLAKQIADNISASDRILKIDLNFSEYKDLMKRFVFDNNGNYYDLKTGRIREVDPSSMFFKKSQLSIPLIKTSEKPTKFFDILDKMFEKDDIDFVIDHIASIFLHTSDLGDRAKALIIQGKSRTWKSELQNLIIEIIGNSNVVHKSLSIIDDDKFFLSMLADNMVWIHEENQIGKINQINELKRIITMSESSYEAKFKKSMSYSNKFPRIISTCNKIFDIPEGDEDKSIFDRLQYVQTKGNEINISRVKVFDQEEMQKIEMFLLRRAHEIYTGKKPIKMMSSKESEKRYYIIKEGTISEFIKENFDTADISNNTGTSFFYIHNLWRRLGYDTVKAKSLKKEFSNLGFEPKDQAYAYSTDDINVFDEKVNEKNEDYKQRKALIMGLVPKPVKEEKLVKKGNGSLFD